MLSRSHRRVLKALLPMVLSGCAVSQSLTDRLPMLGRDRYSEQLLAARMAEQSGELLRARKSYEELLKRHPDKVDLHHRLGVLCQKSGDEQAAISYLSRAHELSPTNVEVLCDLGYSHYLQGKTEEAVEVFRRAQQINPSHPRTQSNLGIALIDMGEISTAMTTLRQSMSESDAASTVGFALAQKGDLLQAREYFTRAIDADPNSQKAAEALVQLGELLAAENNVAPGNPVAGHSASQAGKTDEGQLTAESRRAVIETVDFESLYSQKIEPAVTSESQTGKASVPAASSDATTLSASGHAVVESFSGSSVPESGVLLPPIESSQPRQQTNNIQANSVPRVQLSHTSLRADESAASTRFSTVDAGLEDLAGFVESSPASSPVQGIRSLEDRRRSGGLIEPMLGASERSRKSVSEGGRSLPPVTESVEHGPRRLAASERSVGAEKTSVSQEQVVGAAEQAADAVKTPAANLPTAAPQAVPTPAAAGVAAAGTQMVLVRDASGQFFQMSLVMPAMPVAAQSQAALQPAPVFSQIPPVQSMPIAPQVSPGTYAQAVQQIAFRPAGDLSQAYPQPGAVPMLPQIYANGQPINPAAAQASTAPPVASSPYPLASQYAPGPQYPVSAQYQTAFAHPQSQQYGSTPQYSAAPQYSPAPQYSAGSQYLPAAQYSGPLPAMPQQYPGVNSSSSQPVDGMQPLQGMPQLQSGTGSLMSEPAHQGLPSMSIPAGAAAAAQSWSPRAVAGNTMQMSQQTAAAQQYSTAPQISSAGSGGAAASRMTGAPASVGGLPLAFLRSFYAQMSPEQQALFWRDLRQVRGGSAAEKAVYRELAESSGGLAQIEAAITMLVAFEELELANRLLSQASESEDPTVQQVARTALAMLPVRTVTRR